MLNDESRDLTTLFAAIILALVGTAFLIPTQIRTPGAPGATAPSTPSPVPTAHTGSDVVLSVANTAARYQWSFDEAINAWNTSGANLRFTYSALADAHVVVAIAAKGACGSNPDIAACAETHDSAGQHWTVSIIQTLDRYDEAQVLVHELGHVLGAHHDASDGCVAMAPVLGQGCDLPPPGMWRCRLLAAPDIAQAISIYGGTPTAAPQTTYCPRTPPS